MTVGDEQTDRAFSLGLAALLGKDVYNFGELVRECINTQSIFCIFYIIMCNS